MVTSEDFDAMQRISDSIARWSVDKGWMNITKPRNPFELIALIHSELGECTEAFRMGNPPCDKEGLGAFSNAEEELADTIVRVLQMGAEHDLRVVECMQAKMEYNQGRPYKHGKLH